MQARICSMLMWVIVFGVSTAFGQAKTAPLQSAAQLQVSSEVATTANDGTPTSLRVLVKNAANVTVWMPVLGQECTWVRVKWSGMLEGFACGMSDLPSRTVEGITKHWVQLRPGEFMTTTIAINPPMDGRSSKYWVVYVPPQATKQESAELLQAGYAIPTEEVKGDLQEYPIR